MTPHDLVYACASPTSGNALLPGLNCGVGS